MLKPPSLAVEISSFDLNILIGLPLPRVKVYSSYLNPIGRPAFWLNFLV